ncbi:hypothetical protein H2200_006264 [Cladophialophora chaetospira]|uniref:Uncharacterized protein n=1 Tax=Cladophialophora chaetospira TaxID=386627 RepID=A0AA38XAT3_9EURO|nr:hypothetical protein H2200_006264 [Cladophialophora chaetospira]
MDPGEDFGKALDCPIRNFELFGVYWGVADPQADRYELDVEAYFRFYNKYCRVALDGSGRHIAAKTHGAVLKIAEDISLGFSRSEIKERLRSTLPNLESENSDELLDCSLELAARLIAMVDIGGLAYGYSGRKEVTWTEGTLQELLNGYFNAPVKLGDDVKLQKIFNARNLVRIAGMEIVWTGNLADHLRVDDEDRKIFIFHHASFLKHGRSEIFPAGLTAETIRTLQLLFPQSDTSITKWVEKLSDIHHLDKRLAKCGQLRTDDRQIETFHFWQDRLVILKEIFDESRPSTLSQWWCDRRNGVQWYTFWIAILVLLLTILFGLIQSIAAVLQVYKTYYSIQY